MRSEAADRITNSLFQKLCREKAEERIVLRCPRCKDSLEALQLNKDDKGCQTIWWICRSTLQQKCTFPSDIPTDVFWVERTPQQISEGFIPRPKLHQLPEEYRYLYPGLFPDSARSTPMTSVPTSRPTSAMSRSDTSVNSLHTRDMSLNSELASVASQPSAADSVVVCDSPPRSENPSLDEVSLLVSGSSDAGLGHTSEDQVSAPKPLVKKLTRKRQAEPLPLERQILSRKPLNIEALKIQMQKLYEGGVSDDRLMTIAEKALELQENPSLTAPSRLSHSPAETDDYVDMINQTLPVVTREDARKVVKKKTFAEKMQMMYSLRKATDGAKVLEAIGIQGGPPPEDNHWRSDSRAKVSELVERVIRRRKEHQRRLAEEVARVPRRKIARPDPTTPSTSKAELEKEREKAELLELERKTQALIRSKMRANQEAERAKLLRKVAMLEHQQSSNVSVTSDAPTLNTPPPSVYTPMSSMPFDPAPEFLFDDLNPPSPLDPSASHYYSNPYVDPYVNQPSTSTTDPYSQDLFDFHEPLF